MYIKTFIEFGFRMISWIIKTSCLYYLPQPSASADSTDLGFDNSWYYAQTHPIIVYYLSQRMLLSSKGFKTKDLVDTFRVGIIRLMVNRKLWFMCLNADCSAHEPDVSCEIDIANTSSVASKENKQTDNRQKPQHH